MHPDKMHKIKNEQRKTSVWVLVRRGMTGGLNGHFMSCGACGSGACKNIKGTIFISVPEDFIILKMSGWV